MGEDFLVGAILRLLALLPALTLHEFSHAYSAHVLGDYTPAAQGRVTLNPLAHLDPIGTLMILFAPIGWAKPVMINPHNFRNPARDIVITSAAGPLSNVVQGIFWGVVLRAFIAAGMENTLVLGLVALMTLINFILALFNLIPLGPLDGHEILAYFLPPRMQLRFRQFNRYGFAILIGLILFSFVTNVPILQLFIFLPAQIAGWAVSGEDLWGLIYQAGIF